MPSKSLTTWSAVILMGMAADFAFGQNALFIPDTLGGPAFNLSVQTGSTAILPGNSTPTYGYNGGFLGPTLMMHKGEQVQLNVTNNLNTATTVHWHGFHVAPEHDGGPHQVILPNTTWSPAFEMLNSAGTYWYHPHGEGKTELQVTRGLAGMIIVRDSAEASHLLPRTYGVDDFPMILQTKAFDVLNQFAIASHEDSVMMVNGTIDPVLDVPAQVLRFRLLDGSADRSYLLGLSDNSSFQIIASDGGLLSQPLQANRVRLSPGERVEVLVDFGSRSVGDSLEWISYASELPRGVIGADSVGTASIAISEGYYSNPLNGADFSVLKLRVVAATANAVTSIPSSFAPLPPMDTSNVAIHRHLHFAADTLGFGSQALVDGPFSINNQPFHMDSINVRTYLGDKEIWTLTNSTKVAHPFHIHDIQFFVLDINGNPPPPQYAGLKDVILVLPEDTVRFITRFETFANDSIPYMYHCHLLHHEDDGMMGQFLVLNPASAVLEPELPKTAHVLYPNPCQSSFQIEAAAGASFPKYLEIQDMLGKPLLQAIPVRGQAVDISSFPAGFYHVRLYGPMGQSHHTLLKH